MGSALDGNTTEGSLSGFLAVTTVSRTVTVGIAAVVAGVFLATFGGILSERDTDFVHVCDSGGAAGSNQIAATVTGTSVDNSSVGVCRRHRAQAAIGRKDARLVGEVVAVGDTTGCRVGKRTLGQPPARGIGLMFIVVFDATFAVHVILAARRLAADTGVDVVGEIPDAGTSRAAGALNELVQTAANDSVGAVAKGQGPVIGALTSVVELVGVVGGGSVARVALDALTLTVVNVARLGGLAAFEARKFGFLVSWAAFVAGLAAHGLKEIRRRHEALGSSPTGEHTGG